MTQGTTWLLSQFNKCYPSSFAGSPFSRIALSSNCISIYKRANPGAYLSFCIFFMATVLPECDYTSQGLEDFSLIQGNYSVPKCPNQGNGDWVDPDAPAVPPNMKGEWERFNEKASFFVGGASAGDIRQGRFGTCYFLAALAALAEEAPKKIHSLPALSKGKGAVCIQWYPTGVPTDTWVDTRYLKGPADNVISAHSQGNFEMWVTLLEKAYAKEMGGYQKVYGGYSCDAFADLLGCPALEYDLTTGFHSTIWKALHEVKKHTSIFSLQSKEKTEYTKVACASVMGDPIHRFLALGMMRNIKWALICTYRLLHYLLTLCNAEFLIEFPFSVFVWTRYYVTMLFKVLDKITCGVIFGEDGLLFHIYAYVCLSTIGLMPNHAYSILDVRGGGCNCDIFGKFVKLRNPWGQMEWRSWYSDKSICWKLRPGLKKELEMKDENDGAFWMSLGDFVTYFDLMHVAHLDPLLVSKRAKAKITKRHAYFYFEVTSDEGGNSENLVVYVSASFSRKTQGLHAKKIRLFEGDKKPKSFEDRGLCGGSENDYWSFNYHICTPRIELKPGKYCAYINLSNTPLPSDVILTLHHHKPSSRVRFCNFKTV